MSDLLLKKQEGAILELSLNRPKQYNSFNRPMALALIAALEEAAVDQTVRVIVLTAQGKGFCAGQDLNEVTDPNNGINFEAILEEHYNPIIRLIRQTEKPIIAPLCKGWLLALEQISLWLVILWFVAKRPVLPKPLAKLVWCPIAAEAIFCPVWWAGKEPTLCSCSARSLLLKKP